MVFGQHCWDSATVKCLRFFSYCCGLLIEPACPPIEPSCLPIEPACLPIEPSCLPIEPSCPPIEPSLSLPVCPLSLPVNLSPLQSVTGQLNASRKPVLVPGAAATVWVQ